eukprot:CAMPEP_0168345420 /NCGR_PEP_ID=MMETSP0213-20121227/17547_1 /TAXON_ID=151035 /ORGANISM="Euplotes harpa, Strain FSP1.4" /LENGTH=135 /DNA_ID=CAMNT_0008353641 /DNA_START=225 /DNA_END=632 /DNA_ORIENTATION=+
MLDEGHLLHESVEQVPPLIDRAFVFVPNRLFRWNPRHVKPDPAFSQGVPERVELSVPPHNIKLAVLVNSFDFIAGVAALDRLDHADIELGLVPLDLDRFGKRGQTIVFEILEVFMRSSLASSLGAYSSLSSALLS